MFLDSRDNWKPPQLAKLMERLSKLAYIYYLLHDSEDSLFQVICGIFADSTHTDYGIDMLDLESGVRLAARPYRQTVSLNITVLVFQFRPKQFESAPAEKAAEEDVIENVRELFNVFVVAGLTDIH